MHIPPSSRAGVDKQETAACCHLLSAEHLDAEDKTSDAGVGNPMRWSPSALKGTFCSFFFFFLIIFSFRKR